MGGGRGVGFSSINPEPDELKIGAAGVFRTLCSLSENLGLPEEAVLKLLGTLKIPLIRFPGGTKRYFLLYALEAALFDLGLPSAMHEARQLHRESAGLLYGHVTKEVVRDRIRRLAKDMRKIPAKKGGRPRRRK